MILLGDGWYEEEFDGKRPFTWSSEKSSVIIEEDDDKNAIRFFAGTDSIDRVLKFILNDSIYECDVSKGWVNYYIPYNNESEMIIEIEPMDIEEDDRNLGVMVSMIEVIRLEESIKEIYITPEISEIYQTKDTTVFEIKNLKSPYVDIIYNLDTFASQVRLDEISSDYSQIFELVKGENNSLSYKTKSKDNLKFSLTVPDGISFKVNSVVNRENYYDFLNISSIVDYKDREQEFIEKNNDYWEQLNNGIGQRYLHSIEWFVAWKCNYTCTYCWQEAVSEIYRKGKWNKRAPEDWAKVFNELNPREIRFTGGEPTLYEKLPELINLLDKGIHLTLRTNFSNTLNLDEWMEKVPRDRVNLFFISVHPSQIDSMDDFYKKVDKYLEHYYPDNQKFKDGFGLELVMNKFNIKEVRKLVEYCNEKFIHLSLDPYLPPIDSLKGDGVTKEDVLKELDGLDVYNPYGGDAAISLFEWYDDNPDEFSSFDTAILENKKKQTFNRKVLVPNEMRKNRLNLIEKTSAERLPIFCPAGQIRINVDDNGNVYTCMSAIDRSKLFGEHALPHYQSLGNLFDGSYKRLTKPVICWESFRCSACDSDVVSEYWEPIDDDFNYQLPIPE